MSRERAQRFELGPAAAGSLALHVAVAAAFMVGWGQRELKIGAVVPVTIVSKAPAEPAPAIQAPEEQAAQAETVEAAPPEPAPQKTAPPPPAPTPPKPVPPVPKPIEKAPAPTPAKPAPAKPAPPAPKASENYLDNLYASLAVPARNRPTAAQKGPARPATAPVARDTKGFSGNSGVEVSSDLQGDLERNWSIDCSLSSTRDVVVRVTFVIGAGGFLSGDVEAEAVGSATPAVMDAAKFRARQAVLRSQPFTREPRQNWGRRVYADFTAREFCSRG